MAKEVTATGKDADGDITKLCGPWGSVTKMAAIAEIEAARDGGLAAPYHSAGAAVIVVEDATATDGKYLRTAPTPDEANNLDNLPDC